MRPLLRAVTVAVVTISSLGMVTAASADGFGGPDEADPFAYWTPERVASAAPRDLVIDHRGLGYLRRADGTLAPYGHSVAAEARPLTATQVAGAMPVPRDSAAPSPTSVTFPSMTPGDGATIGGSATFEIHVDSTNGVRQVTAYVGPTGGAVQSFRMSYVGTSAGAEIWRANLQGFSDGIWNWHANVRDGGPKGGTRVDSPPASFIVDTGSGAAVAVAERSSTNVGPTPARCRPQPAGSCSPCRMATTSVPARP